MDENLDIEKLLKVTREVTQIMLESGAEAYRIEQTCNYICRSFGVPEVDSIATPTGIYITLSPPNKKNRTVISRIKDRTIDLSKLNDVNTLSRQLTARKVTLDEALEELNKMKNPEYVKPTKLSYFYEGIAAAFFSLLFKGGIVEFLLALLSGVIVQFIAKKIKMLDSHLFFTGFFGSTVIAAIALLFTHYVGIGDYNIIIVAGIMPLLPGLAMTNAIRDTMRGDLVSGVVRAAEAILVATSLATGAGMVLSFGYLIGLLS